MFLTERKYLLISPQLFTANGTTNGLVTIANTSLFRVKQKIRLRSLTQPLTDEDYLEVKRIVSNTQLVIGKVGDINNKENISAFLTIDFASIEAPEQYRPSIDPVNLIRYAYEEEPLMAIRTTLVDKYGNRIDTTNPLSVKLSDGSINIGTVNAELEVQLSHKDNYPNLGDVADSVRIGNGTNELKVEADGSINTNSIIALPPGISTEAKQDDQITEAQSTNTKLDTLISKYLSTTTDSVNARVYNKNEIVTGSGSVLNAILYQGNVSDYSSIGIQATGTFVATISVYASNDNTNWVPLNIQTTTLGTSSIVQSFSVINQLFYAAVNFKYIQFKITSYSSGTVDLTLFLTTSELDLPGTQIVGIQGGVSVTGYANDWGVYSGAALNAVITPNIAWYNYSKAGFHIYGTFSATMVFECSNNGTNWESTRVINTLDDTKISEITAGGFFTLPIEFVYFRIRISSYTSGTVSCRTITNQNSSHSGIEKIRNPLIINLPMATAGTEYSYLLPVNTKKFRFRTRNNSIIQWCFISGETNTNFMTLSPGNTFIEEKIDLPNTTLYFRASKSSEILEILTWV